MFLRLTKPSRIVTEKEARASYDALHKKDALRESEAHYRWVLRVLSPEKGKKLLDVACGGGYFLREAEKTGVESLGVDISSMALLTARGNAPGSSILCANGEFLPFKDGVFDYVVNLGSLEHFLNPERGAKEVSRILKDDGTACLLLPNSYFLMTVMNVWRTGETGRRTEQGLDRWATKSEWSQLLEENGLKILRVLKYNYKVRQTPIKYKLIRPFIPLHLSYCFLFMCNKTRT
jgi:SAM-dependent methyltransferase